MKTKILMAGSLLLLTVVSSCSKKNDPDPNNQQQVASATITATINGVSTTFNDAAATKTTVTSNNLSLTTIAVAGKSSSGSLLSLGFGSPTITAGTTYTYDQATADTQAAIILYLPVSSNSNDIYANYLGQSTNTVTSVTVTAISATTIQGTFKGTLSHFNGDGVKIDDKTITVTDGKFNAQLTTK
jgi:hypothetical protein